METAISQQLAPLKISQLTQAKEAGFPEALLVPVCPITALPDKFPDRGKCPAIWSDYGWANYKNWQQGSSPEILRAADENGCNIGLRLGVLHGDSQFIFVDIDTAGDANPDSPTSLLAKRIQQEALRALGLYLNQTRMWVRLTRPGRAGVLIELPSTVIAGRVSTIHLSQNGTSAGQIQVLATGQQAVIGGIHPWAGGTPIRWVLIGDSSDHPYYAYPDRTKGAIPLVVNREEVNAAIDHVLVSVQSVCGVTFSYKRHKLLKPVDTRPLSPIEQAPWDPQSFIDLFKRMPHNEKVDYDTWVATMMAARGCIQASIGASPSDLQKMVNAVIEWAARWDDPNGLGTTIVDETLKWEKDWSQQDVKHLGWRHLVELAIVLGDTKLRIRSAQQDFPPTIEKQHAPIPKELKSVKTDRRGERIRFDAKMSEIQIADSIQDEIGKKCAYVCDEKRWIAWGGPYEVWSDKRAESMIREEIANQLVYYVAKNNESFGDNDKLRAQITSAKAVRDIESLLKSRLSITSEDTNKGELILQTPNGPWDLITGEPLEGLRFDNLINLKDTRKTAHAPVEGPTPMYDALIDHLTCGEKGVKEWLLAYFGYALLGKPRLHLIVILYGPGGNGKSTLANIQMGVMGNYATPLDRRVIVKSGSNDHPTGLNMAKGRRLWCTAELSPREEWNEAIVRTISGGDPITARGMHQDMAVFKPEGTLFIYTNFVPAFHRIDEAIVRRFRMIHGRIKVPANMMDPSFEEKILTQEGPAILYKLIQEARQVVANGWALPETPTAIQLDTKRYFANQDSFSLWFMNECTPTRADTNYAPIPVDILYDQYKVHAEKHKLINGSEPEDSLLEAGMQCLSPAAFGAALHRVGAIGTDLGGKTLRTATGRPMVRGIRLKALAEVAA